MTTKTTKTAKNKPKNDAFAAIHSAAQGLHRAGVTTQATMCKFNKTCLEQVPALRGTKS